MQERRGPQLQAEMTSLAENFAPVSGPSEPQSHIEHQAALDATLFRSAPTPHEVVLELDSGKLRLRQP